MLPRISQIEGRDADYLVFSTSDSITNTLFKNGVWEDHLLQISKIFLSGIKEPLLIDIGANMGAYSIPLAKFIYKAGGKVFGFEPQRIIYYQLCANVFLNRLDNYHAVYKAVGDSEGVVEIPEINYLNNLNIGGFSINKEYRQLQNIEDSMTDRFLKVPVISLNSFDTSGLTPALIKIDVEGFELNVIKGAENFLETHRYPPILFEAWNYDWFKQDRIMLINFIEKLGYKITSLGATDYMAQHFKNDIGVEFLKSGEGNINVKRIK